MLRACPQHGGRFRLAGLTTGYHTVECKIETLTKSDPQLIDHTHSRMFPAQQFHQVDYTGHRRRQLQSDPIVPDLIADVVVVLHCNIRSQRHI